MEQLEQNTDLMIRKSNTLISGKFKTSILENKIMAIALTRIEIKDGCPVARLYPGEIKQLLGKNTDTNIYKKLKRTAKLMTGHQIVIEDSKGNFSILWQIRKYPPPRWPFPTLYYYFQQEYDSICSSVEE